ATVAGLLERHAPPVIAALGSAAAPDSPEAHAWNIVSTRAVTTAILMPDRDLVANIGERPAPGDGREGWDAAVAARAVHLLRYDGMPLTPEAAASAATVADLLAAVAPAPTAAPALEGGIELT